MALKFRLKGMAETFIDEIQCPGCGINGSDDENFGTDLTKVTFEGIVVIVQCKVCGEIFVPRTQRLGVLNPRSLREAVNKDHADTGEPLLASLHDAKISAEKLNALRKGELH